MVKAFAHPKSSGNLMSSVMDSHTRIVRPTESFALKSTSEFASRTVNIFSGLSNLENKHQKWVSDNETLETFNDHSDVHEPVQCVPHVFKKPFIPLLPKQKAVLLSRKRKNMKKWIKYSLADVPLSSDATNSAVAFQFLNELRKKREKSEDVTSSTDEKLVFCKPKKVKTPSVSDISASCSTSHATDILCDQNSSSSKSGSTRERKNVTSNVKLIHLRDEFDNEEV